MLSEKMAAILSRPQCVNSYTEVIVMYIDGPVTGARALIQYKDVLSVQEIPLWR